MHSLHLTASETVKYSHKLKKKHPACAPQGVWDFLTFRYYLRCPKADTDTKALYYLNLVSFGILALLAAAVVVFCVVPLDFAALPDWAVSLLLICPFVPAGGNAIVCSMIKPSSLGTKFHLRHGLLANLLSLVAAGLIYFLFSLF